MKKATLIIKGMHCASCASNVERSLSKIKGVSNIRVNVLLGKGYLDCEESVKDDEIKNAVKKAGFSVVDMERE